MKVLAPRPWLSTQWCVGFAWVFAWVFGLLFTLLCAPAFVKEAKEAAPVAQPVTPVYQPVEVSGHLFRLEVAKTPQQKAQGLMGRSHLPADGGMVFLLAKAGRPQPVSFWMKNCRIPLDLLFVREGRLVQMETNQPPCLQDPCPLIVANQPVTHVLEVPAGTVRRLKLRLGQPVRFLEELAAPARLP
ncbi:MAG: DUF192 domain-containing protein [Candidatus Melainabacteria bacterium]|nr:DUF192 domain-containing protein [Candidatus Melainabacteria bacterium]